jgi:hypothetical protein
MRICVLMMLLCSAALAEAGADQVTMNLKEFLTLYEKSKAEKVKPAVSPRHYSIASVHHRGQLVFEDDIPRAVVFDAIYSIEVHRDKGWARIPILPSGVVLQHARLDGKEAPVVYENNQFKLVTNKSGTFKLNVRFVAPIRTKKGQSQMSFQVLPMGANRVELELPADKLLDVTIHGGHDQITKTVRGKRIVTATAPTSGNLSIRWQTELPEAAVQEPRVYSEVETLVSVADGLLQSKVSIGQTILYAGVDQFRVALPKGSRVLQVNASGLRDWAVTEGHVLEVNLNYKAETRYQFDFAMEQVMGEATEGHARGCSHPAGRLTGTNPKPGVVGLQILGQHRLHPAQNR